MKKVFLVFAVAALFVACNDATSTPEVEKAVENVTNVGDTAAKLMDTAATKVMDTAAKAVVVDTLKK